MTNKINARNRRAKKLRAHAIDLKINRLSVFRSGNHIYALCSTVLSFLKSKSPIPIRCPYPDQSVSKLERRHRDS